MAHLFQFSCPDADNSNVTLVQQLHILHVVSHVMGVTQNEHATA